MGATNFFDSRMWRACKGEHRSNAAKDKDALCLVHQGLGKEDQGVDAWTS
jgi:hypothetical protein